MGWVKMLTVAPLKGGAVGVACVLAGLPGTAWPASSVPAEPVEERPLVSNGAMRILAQDFEAFLLRVPEGRRGEFRASLERVTATVEGLYTNRALATEARRLGYDQDPLVALRAKQLEESFLAQLWRSRYEAAVVLPDLQARAQESYKLNPERFKEPERITVEYLQVSLVGRTIEMANDRAQEARSRWLAGESFQTVAAEYGDDPAYARNKGYLRNVRAADLEPALAAVAFALVEPGAISQPVRSGAAVHLFRLVNRTPARQRSFAEVRDGLIREEAARYRSTEADRRVDALKNTDQTRVHDENLLRLVTPFEPTSVPPPNKEAVSGKR